MSGHTITVTYTIDVPSELAVARHVDQLRVALNALGIESFTVSNTPDWLQQDTDADRAVLDAADKWYGHPCAATRTGHLTVDELIAAVRARREAQ